MMIRNLGRFIRDESGSTAAEYGLILALVGSSLSLACIALSKSIVSAVTGLTAVLANIF